MKTRRKSGVFLGIKIRCWLLTEDGRRFKSFSREPNFYASKHSIPISASKTFPKFIFFFKMREFLCWNRDGRISKNIFFLIIDPLISLIKSFSSYFFGKIKITSMHFSEEKKLQKCRSKISRKICEIKIQNLIIKKYLNFFSFFVFWRSFNPVQHSSGRLPLHRLQHHRPVGLHFHLRTCGPAAEHVRGCAGVGRGFGRKGRHTHLHGRRQRGGIPKGRTRARADGKENG